MGEKNPPARGEFAQMDVCHLRYCKSQASIRVLSVCCWIGQFIPPQVLLLGDQTSKQQQERAANRWLPVSQHPHSIHRCPGVPLSIQVEQNLFVCSRYVLEELDPGILRLFVLGLKELHKDREVAWTAIGESMRTAAHTELIPHLSSCQGYAEKLASQRQASQEP